MSVMNMNAAVINKSPKIIIQNLMIVRNTPQHHTTHSKKQSYNSTKPYFIQGLEYAKMQLLQLRKKKQHQQLSYSPITKKHTKLSNDPIMEQSIGEHVLQKSKAKKMTKIKKNQKCYTEMADYEHDQHEQSILHTIKYKGYDNSQSEQLNFKKSLKSQQMDAAEVQKSDNINTEVQNKTDVPKSQDKIIEKTGNKATNIKNELKKYESQINNIGLYLEQANNEIQTYEIVFDNLCDCYRANQNIVNKNSKLRKQAIRLAQEKHEIIIKIQSLQKQSQQLDQMQKMANQYIIKSVSEFVKDITFYNRCDQIILPETPRLEDFSLGINQEEEAEEIYETNLKLNYKKMKQKNDDRIKRKVLMEPKKLQKGVSFQQEIDVITKYYEAELSNV